VAIEHTEYKARQAAARKLVQERGFSAIVAWSRGGSTQDHYADVYYLAGFYTHQPFIPDEPGRWRAHGHTALVLPVDGPGTLLVDMTEVQDPKPAADRVRVTADLVESLATTVMDTVPPGTDVALLGSEALVRRWGRELNTRLPGYRFLEADDLAAEMRLIKSEAELDLLRAAGEIGARAAMPPCKPRSRVLVKPRSPRRQSRRSFARAERYTGWGSPLARGRTHLALLHPRPTAFAAWKPAT
jgi:Xaa-Pro aminopeptidase